MTIDEFKRQLLGGPARRPCRTRPRCQYRIEGRLCGRPAVHECDPGGGHRPCYVCGGCLVYQVCCLGPILRGNEYPRVRMNGEGAIVAPRRSRR